MVETIELKNLKVHKALSEETTCYTATLYINGERVALASNRGHGGGDHYQPVPGKEALLRAAHDYAESLPPVPVGEDGEDTVPNSLEILIGSLLGRSALHADLKNWGRKGGLVYRHDGCAPDVWMVMKSPDSPAARQWLAQRNTGLVFAPDVLAESPTLHRAAAPQGDAP